MTDIEEGLRRYKAGDMLVSSGTAVLVIDMQNMECRRPLVKTKANYNADYFERLEKLVIPNQKRLLDSARRARCEVLFTTIESLTEDGRDRSLDHKISGIFAAKGSYEAEVIKELQRTKNEIKIPKTSSNVFCSTNINYILHNLGIKNLVIVGVVTEQCVEGAVRNAADLGFSVILVGDACASHETESHESALMRLDGHYCTVVNTEDIVQSKSFQLHS